MRYAIYFAPPEPDPLNRAATVWLGRCAFTGSASVQPSTAQIPDSELAQKTSSARRYGFHATVVAPFTLAENETEESLVAALDAYAATAEPVVIPGLVLKSLAGFFALMPQVQGDDLSAFANDAVRHFDRFRAPLSQSEMTRRGGDHLTASQRSNLVRWGYPHVFDDYRFHMTLTDRIEEHDAARFQTAIEEHFDDLLGAAVTVGSLALFAEPEPGAPFVIRSFHTFVPQLARKTA